MLRDLSSLSSFLSSPVDHGYDERELKSKTTSTLFFQHQGPSLKSRELKHRYQAPVVFWDSRQKGIKKAGNIKQRLLTSTAMNISFRYRDTVQTEIFALPFSKV